MLITCTDGVLQYPAVLNLHKTITCGQTFRWFCEGGGAYRGTVGYGGHERKISAVQQPGGDMTVSVSTADFLGFWENYFDLHTDYSRLAAYAEGDAFFARCLEFGRGIHVLRQDLWEVLISFILSQRSNIPRIQSCIGSLVNLFGHFPSPEEIRASDKLNSIRCGYRQPYLKAAAEFGELGKLFAVPYAESKAILKQIKGVGDKVADCVILFGLHNRGAFPVDVWIERVISKKYAGALDTSVYGETAGIVQQYMFYWAINHRGF
jgi:N-glycosylase/DNA lyase